MVARACCGAGTRSACVGAKQAVGVFRRAVRPYGSEEGEAVEITVVDGLER